MKLDIGIRKHQLEQEPLSCVLKHGQVDISTDLKLIRFPLFFDD